MQGIRLATDWVTRPPKLLWRSPIGDGWSAFSVVGGQAVTMEQRGDEEYVSCYELLTGQLLWARANRALHAEALGGVGPRATPTIVGARVFTLGATGLLQCLDLATGRQIWQRELYTLVGLTQADDEAGVAWGRSNSPLVLEDRVIVPLGGKPGPQLHSLAAFDADAVVRDIVEMYEPVAEEQGVRLDLSAQDGLKVTGSRELLGQALVNLVDNALKYGAAGDDPRIAVEARRVGDRVEIVVSDRGPGIAPSDRERVVGRFVRLENSRSRPGSGLGLSLAAAVARMHHGALRIEDNAPGLRVVLSLPAMRITVVPPARVERA